MAGTRHRAGHQSRLDRWRRRFQRQQKTNLTIADFCRQLGVSVPTFSYWKRRVHIYQK
jgi:DNA-binding transcriptional regulator YiaG